MAICNLIILYIYSNEIKVDAICINIVTIKYEQEENLVEIEFLEVIIFNSTCNSINVT